MNRSNPLQRCITYGPDSEWSCLIETKGDRTMPNQPQNQDDDVLSGAEATLLLAGLGCLLSALALLLGGA